MELKSHDDVNRKCLIYALDSRLSGSPFFLVAGSFFTRIVHLLMAGGNDTQKAMSPEVLSFHFVFPKVSPFSLKDLPRSSPIFLGHFLQALQIPGTGTGTALYIPAHVSANTLVGNSRSTS